MEILKESKKVYICTTIAIIINLIRATAKFVVGSMTGLVALSVDGLHSFSDAIESGAILVGLKISERPPSKIFPYGLYKIENLISMIISLGIFYASYRLLSEAISKLFHDTTIPAIPTNLLMLGVVVVVFSFIVSLLLSRYQIRVGEQSNSPSVLADGKETRIDAFADLSVLVSVAGAYFGLHFLDAATSFFISLFALYTAFHLFKDSSKVLLDASITFEEMNLIRVSAESVPGVNKVLNVVGRRSGKFVFAEVKIEIDRRTNVEMADHVIQMVKKNIVALPNIDSVIVHVKPKEISLEKAIVLLENDHGIDSLIADDMRNASYIAIAEVDQGQILSIKIKKNPFYAKDLNIKEWFKRNLITDIYLKNKKSKLKTKLEKSKIHIKYTHYITFRELLKDISKGSF